MTYERFKQIWKEAGIDEISKANAKIPGHLVDNGCTPFTTQELIKVSEGKPSAFDNMDAALGPRKKFTKKS